MPINADTVTSLRDATFRTPEQHSSDPRARSVQLNPLQKRIKVVGLPGGSEGNLSLVRAFHLYLIVAGTSRTTDQDRWRNYIVTLSGACFPSMKADLLQNPLHEDVPLTNAEVSVLMQWYDTYMGALAAAGDPDFQKELSADLAVVPDFGLPIGTPSLKMNADHVLDIPAIYGHYSLVLFLAGKTITDKNRSSVGQKRPAAIERKYYAGVEVASLTGALALSDVAHNQIHSAFVFLTHARRVIFSAIALFNNQAGDPAQEAVATTTRLMRYAGMQQAVLIDRFLSAHDEAFRIPMLASSIAAYAASLHDLAKAPEEIRPYYKIIYGDTTRAFNRNEISNLLSVALEEARTLNPTLQQYNLPDNHQLVLERYARALTVLMEEEE